MPRATTFGSTLLSALVLAVALVGASSGARAADAGAPSPSLPACIGVRAEARYVPYGYNHVVILTNGCSKAATCRVSTDVSPQPVTAEVAAGTTVEVLTFAASPASSFTPRVSCTLR